MKSASFSGSLVALRSYDGPGRGLGLWWKSEVQLASSAVGKWSSALLPQSKESRVRIELGVTAIVLVVRT